MSIRNYFYARVSIIQCQKKGLELAKLRNIKFGRPKIQIDDNFKTIYKQWKDGILIAKNAMKVLELKSNTFYRRVSEYEELNKEVVCSG